MSKLFETPEAIIAGISKGDQEAETAMIEKYGRALMYILEKRTGDKERAKDLQQETFLVVLQKLRREPLSDPTKLAAYLQNTAVNLHIGEIRKEVRRKTSPNSDYIEAIESSNNDAYRDLVNARSKVAVKQLLEELQNARDRKILTLYYIEEKDKVSICEILDLSHRHFDRVISRARSRFREIVESRKDEIPLEMTT
ncbi:MAG: sigma-70 family RNA polymerase sigma factor [Pseudomonadales bacterium]|nr:sigma-70 family RNA polymerase sigma factor [Pseudomonadales bacterium]